MKKTRDFGLVITEELAADPQLDFLVELESLHASVAEEIVEAREAANLSQVELARQAHMQQSNLARLEDADYHGHSLNTLHKVAWALGMRVDVKFYKRQTLVVNQSERTPPFSSPPRWGNVSTWPITSVLPEFTMTSVE